MGDHVCYGNITLASSHSFLLMGSTPFSSYVSGDFPHIVISIAQLLLGLIILAFPLVLAFAFSFFFTGKEDDEGISNEDLWAKERKASAPMTITPSRNLDSKLLVLHILSLWY